MRSLNIKSRFGEYDIKFYDKVSDLQSYIQDGIVIVDAKVYQLYKNYLPSDSILFDCVEQNKTLDGSITIFRELIKRKVKSNGKIVAIGGGILQDVVGFVCSTYCRGIQYDLIPTTLLSQCDSCIGGKTSINFESVKNILGTFYPPNSILICPEFINTLTNEDRLSGMGELIKFNILKNTTNNINNSTDLIDLIYDGLSYKASIIQIDEFDKNERKFLNFGHTFGHALESISNYKIPHGTSVLFGILIANKVSNFLGLLSLNKELELFDLIYPYIKHEQIEEAWFNFNNLISIIKHDKKNTGTINMVLLTDEEPKIVPIESEQVFEPILKNVYASIRLRNKIS
jgi:3-dehydroquinate synthase